MMVDVSPTEIIMFCIAILSVGSTIILVIKNHKGQNKVQQEVPTGVKRTSKQGQEDFVEVLRESASETIEYLQSEIKRLKDDLKSKNGQIAKLNGLMYGSNDPAVIAEIQAEQQQIQPIGKRGKTPQIGNDIIEARLSMIKSQLVKNNVNPIILEIPEISDALASIASSDNFDRIAATILQQQSRSNTILPASSSSSSNDL